MLIICLTLNKTKVTEPLLLCHEDDHVTQHMLHAALHAKCPNTLTLLHIYRILTHLMGHVPPVPTDTANISWMSTIFSRGLPTFSPRLCSTASMCSQSFQLTVVTPET